MPHLRDGYEPILNNMQVYVQNNLPGSRNESVTIATSCNATVGSVISSFCTEKGIIRSQHLTLFNSDDEALNPLSSLEAEGIVDGSFLYLGIAREITATQPKWGVLAFIAIVIGGGGLLAVILLYTLTGGVIPFDYAVVIDAGSTHSQVLLYEWAGDKDMGTADVVQHDTCSVDGGLAVMENPKDIMPCVNKMVDHIPSAARPHSFLYLGATAGMRLLNLSSQRIAELILLNLRCDVAASGIVVKRVDIISGIQEGVSAWVTTNFLLKTLHLKGSFEPWTSTFGALDLGGASTQFAFAVDPKIPSVNSSLAKIRLYGHSYTIAADTYLCYGFMESIRRHRAMLAMGLNNSQPIYDPCLPKGNVTLVTAEELFNQPCTKTSEFDIWLADHKNRVKVFKFLGGSDYKNCSALVKQQMNSSLCEDMGFQECATPPAMFLTGEKYIAVSGFFYISSFLNSTNVTLEEFESNVKDWCSTTWPEMAVLPLPPKNKKMILTYCFGGNYMLQWLQHMYGFNASTWNNLMFQDKVGGNDLGWALGFMVNASNAIPEEAPTPSALSTATFVVLVIICMLIIFISIILLRKYLAERHRRKDPEGLRIIET